MPPAPPPDGIVGLRTWSPASYNSAPEGPDDASNAFFYLYCGFGPACAGSGDTAATGFRAPFHKSVSQLSILTTARNMIDQGTYRSSACPYECTRKITRHEVVQSNEANMLSGIGMLGEGFVYSGHLDDPGKGFSRFPSSGPSSTPKLHALHMSHNVTMDQCDDIVHRHQLLAPHGVWLVNGANEEDFASAERLGDCGLFLGVRSSVDADIWRAFYKYARMVLRLGHVDTWLDDDVLDAIVHSSSEKACVSSTSKVCLWWSEFDLDDEEYSCRPKRDASNIVTPSILLATLAENKVAYPPPSPPPPTPPTQPPAPSPPPGANRCELSNVATTSGYKVPAFDLTLNRMVLVQKKCWKWDPGNNWPPFVAHRDVYLPRDRCAGADSRDVQWDGGFNQPVIGESAFDPAYQNNDDCSWKALLDYSDIFKINERKGDGFFCSDGEDTTNSADETPRCELGTNVRSCGIRENLVVFGYAFIERFNLPTAELAAKGSAYYRGSCTANCYTTQAEYSGLGSIGGLWDGSGGSRPPPVDTPCISKVDTTLTDGSGTVFNYAEGEWADFRWPGSDPRFYDMGSCLDGGPGSVADLCYYGTDPACGKRRFAFRLEDAGPDVPDNSCESGSTVDGTGATVTYGALNGKCEDGLMWSIYAPGKNPCPPNTDLADCGWRHPKRPTLVGEAAESDTCEVPSYKFNPTATSTTEGDPQNDINALCSDFSDDMMHGQDLRLHTGDAGPDEQCGRGTQAGACRKVAEDTIALRFRRHADNEGNFYTLYFKDLGIVENAQDQSETERRTGSLAYNNYKYRNKFTYINPMNVGQGVCVSPVNMLHDTQGNLVRPRLYQGIQTTLSQERTAWFEESTHTNPINRLQEHMLEWPKTVCSDGGEGSVRVPLQFGVARYDGQVTPADDATKFIYDFGCPYGSQPEACPPREDGRRVYQETMDEREQPSGPPFANCFDEDVPDFECCHAENEFRIHGGGGIVGNDNGEDLQYCALPRSTVHAHGLTNENMYKFSSSAAEDLAATGFQIQTDEGDGVREEVGTSIESCMATCDSLTSAPTKKMDTGAASSGDCRTIDYINPDNDASTARCQFYTNQAPLTYTYRTAGEYGYFTQTGEDIDRLEDGEVCPLHYTSYHHTSTGCEAFCRQAFQREGDDNTCMPGKPECANWLDANDFPTEQYVTVNAECICGAKLEELQNGGQVRAHGHRASGHARARASRGRRHGRRPLGVARRRAGGRRPVPR